MQRRHLLQAGVLIALEPLLFGCNNLSADQLRIQLLRGSLPLIVTKEFRQRLANTDFKTFEQLADMAVKLQDWQNPQPPNPSAGRFPWEDWRLPWQAAPDPSPPDLVTLGNGWLRAAIDQKSIQPLGIDKISGWQQLDPKWQQLVTVNQQIWAAPYRWGSTVIIYRRDLFSQNGIAAPQDWADLWQPALQGKVVLLNHPQEIIGLTLKKLGHTYQTDPQQVQELLPELQKLHRQALFYSSDTYLPPLLVGDAWAAVGWSSDLGAVLKRSTDLAVTVPSSGTALWADLWVRPVQAKTRSIALADRWIEFCWQSLATTKISSLTGSLPPLAIQQSTERLDQLTKAAFDRGEFLLPLDQDRQSQYDALWQAKGDR